MIEINNLNEYIDYFSKFLSAFGKRAFIDSVNKHNMSVLDIRDWAKNNALPSNPIDWDEEQKMLCRLTWL